MPTTTRPPGLANARLCLFAAALVSLATSPTAAAQPPEPRTTAGWTLRQDEAIAAWRIARGLDPPGIPAGPRTGASFEAGPGTGAKVGAPRNHALAIGPSDDPWRPGFGLPVPDRTITTLLPHDGRLVVGGWFKQVGVLEALGIAAWDGRNWSTLGDYPGQDVQELASHPGGLLALSEMSGVWQWDGVQWHPLLKLPPWVVSNRSMAVVDDRVAVSVLVQVGSEWRSRVLLGTPSGWTTLGGDFQGMADALAWYGGELFAGGDFDSVGGAPLSMVARWDGSDWRAVGEGLPGVSHVGALAVFNGELVAAGSFRDDIDPGRPRFFARWDGTRWAALGTGAPEYPNVMRLRAIGPDLYAVGRFQIGFDVSAAARWDGTTWHVGEDSLEVLAYDIANFQGELYAGGGLVSEGSRPAPLLVRRRDGRWEAPLAPGAGMHGLLGWDGPGVSALVAMEGGIAAAGRFGVAGDPGGWLRCPGAAQWNGGGWSSLGFESWSNSSPVELVLHEGVLHAAGYFSSWSPSYEYAGVVRREGGGWRVVGPNGGPFPNVYCMASALGYLFVGGSTGFGSAGVAYWDGTAWQVPGGSGASYGGWVAAMTEHGSDVIVAGNFESIGGVPCRNIAAWNPLTGWRPLGDGVNGRVYDVLSRGGALYVAGYFSVTGRRSASAIARWKDGRWEPLGWAGGTVSNLGWYRGRLVGSGYGLPGWVASLEADSTWHPLGSGVNGLVLSMVESGPSLFLGGYFSQAGGHAAYGFAEYREVGGIEPILAPSVSAAPNPFAAAVTLRYELATGTRVRIEIFDLAGKVVDRPFDGFQGAGPQQVIWRPASPSLRAGVYFGRIVAAGTTLVVRVALLE